MKLPVPAPQLTDFIEDGGDLDHLLQQRIGPEVAGVYEHWDHLRHLSPPSGLTSAQWWAGIKLARLGRARAVPLLDKDERRFTVSLTDTMLRKLHFLDREAAGLILGADRDDDASIRRKHLERSLIEEAMTSSQLEGASTTRRVAKEMLVTGRAPRDRSEQMIFNNYSTMQSLAGARDKPLTRSMILDIHRRLMREAMDDPDDIGRFRTAEDDVAVFDKADPSRILHRPPPAGELPERLQALCDFANDTHEDAFLHPIVKAILLHFMIGYDHPFCDGNGRTARALFYWSMLRSGYWLSEYVSISSVLKKAPEAYARSYLQTESDGADASYFVSHQLDVLIKAVNDFRGYLARKGEERKQSEALLRPDSSFGGQLNHRQRALLLHAIRHPDGEYTISRHQAAQRVTYATARSDLLGLVSMALFTQRKRGKGFVFVPITDLSKRLNGKS
ncbi:MAG: Fic family protein [Thermomonas sp.]